MTEAGPAKDTVAGQRSASDVELTAEDPIAAAGSPTAGAQTASTAPGKVISITPDRPRSPLSMPRVERRRSRHKGGRRKSRSPKPRVYQWWHLLVAVALAAVGIILTMRLIMPPVPPEG